MSKFYEKLLAFFNKGSNEGEVDLANFDESQLENLEEMIDTSWAGYATK